MKTEELNKMFPIYCENFVIEEIFVCPRMLIM